MRNRPGDRSATDTQTAAETVRDRLIDAAEAVCAPRGSARRRCPRWPRSPGCRRGWLYRHFPDKVALLGAAIVRLNDAYWGESHALLDADRRPRPSRSPAGVATGAQRPTTTPGALLMKLRRDEPEEFAACAGAGVQGLVPDLARVLACRIWPRRRSAARSTCADLAEAAEWVARTLMSLATVPGDTLDPDDGDALLRLPQAVPDAGAAQRSPSADSPALRRQAASPAPSGESVDCARNLAIRGLLPFPSARTPA